MDRKKKRERSKDPLLFICRKPFIILLSSFWLFASFLIASPPEVDGQHGGMGGSGQVGANEMGGDSGDLPADESLCYDAYVIQPGEILSQVAAQFNITIDTIYSFNDIKSAKAVKIGQVLKIPNMSGIMYTVHSGDSVKSIAQKNEISADKIIEVNGLMTENLSDGERLFLPDAKLPSAVRREISGDLFHWPVRGYLTSYCGWRNDPFTGSRSYHNGLDIGAEYGSGIGAAADGTVETTAYTTVYGNCILIRHGAGYKTFYGHLSKIAVKPGQYVSRGQYIGNVGTTGQSTGPHLHFTVYKWGRVMNPLLYLP
jgi:murein DD-endopeptidase MepM/ murein hydrolase activator NlpD